jgi:peptidoglycan/xylan/chitin deacetylase (PgdA/CDA1 family)
MRRIVIGLPLAVVALIAAAVVLTSGLGRTHARAAAAVTSAAAVPPALVLAYVHDVTSIPVLAWHQVDEGCSPSAAVCDAKGNDETVSRSQFVAELSWLKGQGYQSVTAGQYVAWAAGLKVALPAKPVLLTFDDGTVNSYTDTTAVLKDFGFNAVTFIVSQFADGAAAGKRPYAGWDMTWAQLRALPPDVWSFAFHAGSHGHSVTVPQNMGCTYYYPCQLPTETDAAYQGRVSGEITAGRLALRRELGSRLDTAMWAVPWNDIAQQANLPVSGKDPARWLATWAASQFQMIFIQDPAHNGYQHQRYRLEIHGTWTQGAFEANVLNNIRDGFFRLAA